MSIFSLSLLFLSPIIGYATYILLIENRDPLTDFHDEFLLKTKNRKLSLENDANSYNNKADPQSKSQSRTIYISFIIAIGILFLIGAAFLTIFLLVLVLLTFRFWEHGSSSRARKKSLRLSEEEFPSIVELFAVLVSAGESPTMAMLRVSENANGELANKFTSALLEVKKGKNLTQSLEVLGSQVDSAMVRRFCDTLILAMERGTSLSDVLTRQVEEVRAEHHASLLTAAGKAEIALMVPVIFLILPISVLFALWPSYVSLGQSVMG
jgi:pilus assembly protein TadC